MSTNVTIKCELTFDEAFLLGARAYYMEGDEEKYYPGLNFKAIDLPDGEHFPRDFRLKGEPAFSSIEEAEARARVVAQTTICKAVANMILSNFAQEP